MSSPTTPSLGTRVVEAIAEAKGTDTSNIGPLYEVIDLEALESLYAHSGSEWRVEFDVNGDRVVVRDDGTINVNSRNCITGSGMTKTLGNINEPQTRN